MPYWIRVFALVALTAACQAGSRDVSAVSQGASSSAIQLTVHLVELTANITPVGLPSSLVIDAIGHPRAGERVAITWRAVDGDEARGPRAGWGTLEITALGDGIIVKLAASDRAATDVLTLSGTMTGTDVRGTFTDRLFFARAGRFDGQMQEK